MCFLSRVARSGARSHPRLFLQPHLPSHSTFQSHIKIPRSPHAPVRTKARTAITSSLSTSSASSLQSILLRRVRSYRHQRRTYSSSPPPSPPTPTIVLATIGLCCGIFCCHSYAAIQLREHHDPSLDDFFRRNMVNSGQNWREGRWWTLLTSSFTHINLLHLGVNMFSLFSIGPWIVGVFGVGGYVLTWVGSSMACCGYSLLWDDFQSKQEQLPKAQQPGAWRRWEKAGKPHVHSETVSAGASGSVLGLSAALGMIVPRFPIQIFPIPIPLSLWVFNTLFAAGSTYCMFSESLPIIGHAGHLGGMGGGLVCAQLLRLLILRRL